MQPDPAQQWTLPVCFKTENGQDCQVLTPADSSLPVPSAHSFFANAGGKGYYRSAYPASVYAALVSGVETALTPTERISLIGDEWAQVRANKAPTGAYLDLVAAVKADPSAQVIGTALSGVYSITGRVASTPEQKAALAAWMRSTFGPQYAKLGAPAESDSANTRELRAQLFAVLGYYGKDPAVLAQAKQITEQYLADPASVDATLGQTALSIAARNGDAALFDRLQKLFETSTNPELQQGALSLLAQFTDPALTVRALDYAASGKVRNQDTARQFGIALQLSETREQAWKYIQSHWDQVQTQVSPQMLTRVVASTGAFCTQAGRDSVKDFFTTHKVPAANISLKHALEHIDGCIELRTLQEPNLNKWLAAQPK
jgi:aminopeptidase N/puromycin-sensitive aminopeptidase